MSGVNVLNRDELRNCKALFTCDCGQRWKRRIDECIFDWPCCPKCKGSLKKSALDTIEYDYS